MRIEQFDPATDEPRLRECYELAIAGHAEDDPNVPPITYRRFRGSAINGWADNPQQIWLASDAAGTLLGSYVVVLPERDNRTNAFLDLFVHPSVRRQGIGTALLAHAGGLARRADRTLLMSGARVGSPGCAFAEAIGAKPGMEDIRRILDVDPELRARIPVLRAEAETRATGYTLQRWAGVTPEAIIDSVAALNAAMADAPHDESFEPIAWDADRVRREDQRTVDEGARFYSTAAVDDVTGAAVALTQVYIDPDLTSWAFQGVTAVLREHRGHRLGMLVKLAMLQELAETEPEVEHIVTDNAEPNQHMIAINEQLGHRISDRFRSFELDVEAAERLGGRVGAAEHS